MPEQETQQAFCSYCRQDADFALRLAGDLKAAGAHVWLDQLDIVPGQRWDRAVEDALAACPRMLVILSSFAVNSTNVMDEVSAALEANKIVIPVIYGDCNIPFRLRRLQHVDFRLDYGIALTQLLRAFGIARQADTRGWQTTAPPGIDRPVTIDHAARDRAETSLLDNVERTPSTRRLRGAMIGLSIAAPLLVFVVVLGWLSLDPLERAVRNISLISLPLIGLIVGAVVGDFDTRSLGGVAGATVGGLNTLLAWPLGWWLSSATGLGTEAMDVFKAVMLYLPGAALASGLVGIAVVSVAKVLSSR